MRKRSLKAVFATMTVALSGCAGINRAFEYSDVHAMPYVDARDTWRIFDKPAESRLMITPSLEKSGQQGAVTGATLGLENGFLPEPIYHEVVERYLASTGRQCSVGQGEKLITPQWEFKYTCH